ncbi:MAG: hypothetical protein WCG19_00465 [Chlorobiaceae bacterium]
MTRAFRQKIFARTNPVKKKVLDRYEQTAEGAVIIDVAARSIEDLYEDFDKTAPYHKKDLDEDLVYYLTECVREIGHADFVIRFMFERFPSEEFMQRVRTSVHKFFMYQRELELAALKKMLRTSGTLLSIGVVILGISLWVNHLVFVAGTASFLNSVFAEGLTIIAWVSMWEALATFLLHWSPHRFQINLFKKIAEAPVFFYQPKSAYSEIPAGLGGSSQI